MSGVRHQFVRALALFGFLTVLSGAPALARDGADPETYRNYDVGNGLVTLDVADATFGQVVKELIEPRTRINIVVSPKARDLKVTLKVTDLHWVQTLDALVEQIGAVMVRKASNLLRIERPDPITFEFSDVDVKEVVSAIATSAQANVIVSPKVQGNITLSLHGTPWRESLEQVVRTLGYALVEDDYGILVVLPRDELELDTDYYRFSYLRPPAPYKARMAAQTGGSGGSGGGGGGAGGGGGSGGGGGQQNDVWLGDPSVPTDDPTKLADAFPIIAALASIVEPDGGSVKYMPDQNAIIYTGTRPRLQRVATMAHQLDVEPPQVFIDMNFVVTRNSDMLKLGMDAGESSGIAFGMSGSDILHMLPWNAGSSGTGPSWLNGTPFPPPSASSYTYGTLTTSETALLFNFLQRDQSTKIVQAPKLLALDNVEATIFIGESIRYARTTAATNQNGGLEFSVEEDPNSPVNVGFQLLVIPHVIPGEQKIRMTVIPQRRALTGTGPLPGFDRITVSGQTIDLPRVQSSTLVTHMILRDNQTAVIGGLLEDRDVERVDKVPFLGDLPLLGPLLQGKGYEKVKDHLLITITPRIITGTDATSCSVTNELSGRAARVATEYRDLEGRAFQSESCVTPQGVPPASWPAATPCAPPPPPPPPADPIPVAPGR
jgi:type IV pilus assembly protein PilQ